MISIIIPMYNVQNKIERTLSCILNQKISDYEVIIVDDCSKDQSYEMCKKFIELHRLSDFYLIKNETNKGPSYSRNIGLRNAKGDYCILLDSDDYYEDGTLKQMLYKMEDNSMVVVGIKYLYKKNKVKYILYDSDRDFMEIDKTKFVKFFLTGILNQPSNKMYDLKLIKENGIFFNEKSSYGEDIEFNLKYIKNALKITYINKPLYVYTESKTGLNNTFKDNELMIAKNNFLNKINFLQSNFQLKECETIRLYNEYLKERVKMYRRYNMHYKKKDNFDILKEIIEEDNIDEILKNTSLSMRKAKIVKRLIQNKNYLIAQVVLKLEL